MKIAIYPGSFNPFHDGHADVVRKAIDVFDKVIIAIGYNPDKEHNDLDYSVGFIKKRNSVYIDRNIVEIKPFTGLLKDFALKEKATAIIKGIRDINDFQYEQKQQYWNEDLGIHCPTVYIISDRKLVHYSSSAVRAIEKIK